MNQNTIADIKALLNEKAVDQQLVEQLRKDPRKGVQRLLALYDKQQLKVAELEAIFQKKKAFDRQYCIGNELVAGVDEAGRGPLAGPVTAAAVILPDYFSLPGLTDSKQLPEPQRRAYYDIIRQEAIDYHIEVIDHLTIDRLNIYEATKLAMIKALEGLKPAPAIGLIDAVPLKHASIRTEAIIKGDDQSLAIAAASVLAKVKRDQLMQEIHRDFPQYGFHKNNGYGTKAHLEALESYGPCKYHRRSFSPVSELS